VRNHCAGGRYPSILEHNCVGINACRRIPARKDAGKPPRGRALAAIKSAGIAEKEDAGTRRSERYGATMREAQSAYGLTCVRLRQTLFDFLRPGRAYAESDDRLACTRAGDGLGWYRNAVPK
jgi:hypothetical protein